MRPAWVDGVAASTANAEAAAATSAAGVRLVEIRSLIRFVDSVGRSVGEATALANDGPLFTALVVTSAATGFWFLYYWSWMYGTRLDAKMRAEVSDANGRSGDETVQEAG